VEILRLVVRSPADRADGKLATFDVRLFGRLTIHDAELRQRDDGQAYVVTPGGRTRRKGRPRVNIHDAQLRAEITHKAAQAYVGAAKAQAAEVRS
jgi:hypothetical protein